MRTAIELIVEGNRYLDSIKKPETVRETEKNVKVLSKLKEEMIETGFSAPFSSIVAAISKEFEEESDSADMAKQLRIFRELANAKKYILYSVRIALAANKIFLNMLKREKIYEVANFLPYDGSHLSRLIYLGEPAIRAYNVLQKILGKKSEGYVAVVRQGDKKTNIYFQERKEIEEKIKQAYGEVPFDIKELSPPLVRKQSVRTAIAAAYAAAAAEKVYLIKYEKKSPEHERYTEIIHKVGLSEDTKMDLIEGHEELKDFLYSKGLLEYSDDSLKLVPEIAKSISKRRSFYSSNVTEETKRQFALDVFHFLITESKRVRTSIPFLPGLSAATKEQLGFLSAAGITNSVEILEKKFQLETVVNMPGKDLGMGLTFLYGQSVDSCGKIFETNEEEIKRAAAKVAPYIKEISPQAKEFLDLLK